MGAWRAFLAAHARVWRRLDEDLRAEHGLSLAEYETLLLLAQATDGRLRMRAIADALQLSKSGVTRLVDRLVAESMVERRQCPTDARGAEAQLTHVGLERLRAAAPAHDRGIRAYFLAAMSEQELVAIEQAMLAVARRVPGGESGRVGPSPTGVRASRTTFGR